MHATRFALLTLVLIALHGSHGRAGAPILGTYFNLTNRHGYYLLPPSLWSVAEADAESLGGHLVTVNDSTEQSWLLTTFGPIDVDNSPNSFWVGLFNASNNSYQWTWTSGEPFGYSNWYPGEPNGLAAGDDEAVCVGRYAGGQWNDTRNDNTIFPGHPPQPRGVVEFSPLPGDANLDGTVNLSDFSILAVHFQQQSPEPWRGGDFDVDGDVDLADFAQLASNFNRTIRPQSADVTIPEPASLSLWPSVFLAVRMSTRRRRLLMTHV